MNFRLRFHRQASLDLTDCYRWAARHAPFTALRWFRRFRDEIDTLEMNPELCSLAPENRRSSKVIRQLLYGRKPNVYRVVFFVESDLVHILRVRRAQRRPLTRREIEEAIDDEPDREED